MRKLTSHSVAFDGCEEFHLQEYKAVLFPRKSTEVSEEHIVNFRDEE